MLAPETTLQEPSSPVGYHPREDQQTPNTGRRLIVSSRNSTPNATPHREGDGHHGGPARIPPGDHVAEQPVGERRSYQPQPGHGQQCLGGHQAVGRPIHQQYDPENVDLGRVSPGLIQLARFNSSSAERCRVLRIFFVFWIRLIALLALM